MSKKQGIASIGMLLVVACLGAKTQVQRYSAGPPPTIGDIQTMCVEQAPAPQTRTDVGIGEEVLCWIDTNTWQDTDLRTDTDGNKSNVSDTLGEVVWSVEGLGTVYPIVTDGSAVTLTIDLADFDGTATAIATVRDSGTLGEDPPLQKRKVLNVKTPGGVQILQAIDQPPVEKAGKAK
jgi:hypothetical protein